MRDDYLLTLSGRGAFREVELPGDVKQVRVGTSPRCEVRFRKDHFFAPFELEFMRSDAGHWEVSCSEEVYLAGDGVGKMAVRRLAHGDELAVRYNDTNATLLTLRFSIDFERERAAFDRWVDLRGKDAVTMGGMPNCNICLNGSYTDGDLLALERVGGEWAMTEQASRYGVLHNGVRMKGRAPLRDHDFVSLGNFHFYFKDERLYCSKAASLLFNGVDYFDMASQFEYSQYPRFNRNTRIKSVMDDEPIALLDPPQKPEKPRGNVVLQLLPAVGMLLITVLLRGSIMNSAGSQGFIIISACSIGVGILTSALAIISDKWKYRKDVKERDEGYRGYIDAKRNEIAKLRAEELASLDSMYPSVDEELGMVESFSAELFDRRADDEDFLDVRLGVGSRTSVKPVEYKQRESLEIDDLAELPAQVKADFETIDNAPISLDLANAGAVGIVGPPSKRQSVINRMIVDLTCRQYKDDVKLFFMVEPENEELIHWARLLPHVQNDDLNCRNIVCDEESKNVLFEYLYKELTARAEQVGQASKSAKRPQPALVIFVIDECGLKNHPLCKFVDNAAALGVTFLFFEQLKEFLPQGCSHVVELAFNEDAGSIVDAENGRKKLGFMYDPVAEFDVEQMATTLAPVYCEEVSLEGSLTKSISLFEMLGIIAADDLDLGKRWASSRVESSLAAPLGVSKSHVVSLDLHDKAHGPHGLVAGTTGSGKSEILQSYVLSMASLFHPYEVGFVIIDFKGGGMANQFRDLPHLMGAIANIDGREMNRSLKSIKAELQKRQRLFAEADVNHISAYIKKYKAGKVANPLPHLIIIVDEFAELKAEQPEFMKELISAARIGRSLGVHLILATQKPAGQVNEQIWSNSRFKLCLKVAGPEDSNEVIKSPLAAEIKEPGRAYLQVGNNEIFELFQSAFSGAPEHEDEDNTKEFTLFEVENSGKRVPVFEKRRKKSDTLSATQLDAIVSYVSSYCAAKGIKQLPSICLPSLPEHIGFPDALPVDGARGMALGVYDDPDSQYQGPALFDFDNANTFIVGSASVGKTNLLQCIIRGIAQTRTPRQAAVYIMDFASMTLKNFEGLAHVGGVVIPSEEEKVKNLFKLLGGEVARRQAKLLEVGVSSFAAYEEAGYDDLPHVYLIIDNFAVFKELYAERYEDELLALCRDGLAYGITVTIANNATSGFGFKFQSCFSSYLALQCNDSGEYSLVFDRCRMEPKAVAGRALCSFDKNVYEFQSYLAFEGEREVDRVRAIKDFVAQRNACCGGERARAIPCVPDDLTFDYIRNNYDVPCNEMAFALDYSTVEPLRILLDSQFSVAVVGKKEAARANVVRTLLVDVAENIFDRPAEVAIIDGMTRELAEWADQPFVTSYCSDGSELGVVLEDLDMRLAGRYDRVRDEGLEALADEPYLIVVVHAGDALAIASESKETVDLYNRMAKQYAAMRVLFVFSGIDDGQVSFSSPGMLKAIKEERRAFVAMPLGEHKMYDINGVVVRANKAPLEVGQVFYVSGQDVSRVKLATSEGRA